MKNEKKIKILKKEIAYYSKIYSPKSKKVLELEKKLENLKKAN